VGGTTASQSPSTAITQVATGETDATRATQRRNFLALMGDYILFGVAFGFLNPSMLPPDFVSQMGGGPVLVGLAGLVFKVVWLVPQLLFAPFVNRARRKKHYATIPGIPARFVFIPASLLMIAVGPANPGLLIVLLLGSYATLGFGDGLSAVPWMDVIGSSLNNQVRSRLFAIAPAISGLTVALVVSPLVRFILGPRGPAFPNNYALLLTIASVLLLLGLGSYSLTKEGDSPPPKDSPGLREYRRFLGNILRNDAVFRHYIIMRFFYDLSAISIPFYIVFATSQLGQESAIALSDQILLMTTTSFFAALALGRVNERSGARNVTVIAAFMATLGPLFILSSRSFGVISLHLLWITVGVLNSSFLPGFLNWVVEYAPDGYRPIYSGLSNTFGVLALMAPILGGVIVAKISYDALFIVAAVLGTVTLLLALRLPEPRKMQKEQLDLLPVETAS
jgi:MFS family permease